MIKAEWGTEYDWRTDKCYKAPMHKYCYAPVIFHDEKYVCVGCGKEMKVSFLMKIWFKMRTGEKTKTETCFKCNQKTMVVHLHRNHRTLKWETGYGECKNCNIRFIV